MIKNSVLLDDMGYIMEGVENLDAFRHKTILITGCAGFLGMNFSHFFYALMDEDYDISLILCDNFMLYKPAWIDEFKKHPRIEVLHFDVIDDELSQIAGVMDVDYVIHLATIASPTYYRKFPIMTMDANVIGLRRLLDFYKDKELEGFLFFSSSEIYGDPPETELPMDEEYRGNVATMGPRACYDESKRYGETLCYYYSSRYNMPITIVRPFNNYGPGMPVDDKRVPADFAKCILDAEDIVILSDGSPSRTFCYVADAMRGYIKALLYKPFNYFNIGIGGPEVTISQLAEVYAKVGFDLFGYQVGITYEVPEEECYLTHNPKRRCPDIRKAKSVLHYKPKITVEEGVKRYLEYLLEEMVML